ncbi:hypothetical protein [Comamonas sp. JUb58]|uniref:hypothetical protein n=1 Tax=Comamonas sp. JUb58 TaxID=2485114 RepID=UPI0010615619|nr:hypothetical protein [Comamonas sp. JUb58]
MEQQYEKSTPKDVGQMIANAGSYQNRSARLLASFCILRQDWGLGQQQKSPQQRALGHQQD